MPSERAEIFKKRYHDEKQRILYAQLRDQCNIRRVTCLSGDYDSSRVPFEEGLRRPPHVPSMTHSINEKEAMKETTT